MIESKLWRDIRDKLSRGAVRLFRNENGHGLLIRHRDSGTRQRIIAACTRIAEQHGGSAARITYGLGVGTGDLIGMKRVTITPDMVGQEVAVFLSVEVKTATGGTREEQKRWLEFVNGFGGIALIARSVEDAQAGIDKGFSARENAP